MLDTVLEPIPTHYFSAGIHPWYISSANYTAQWNNLVQLANTPNCIAIGECGLDKFQGLDLNTQERVFIQQIEFAIAVKKPVIVHCAGRYNVLLKLLKNYKETVPFIVHGFNKNEQIANQLLQHGACLSFGRALLNKNNKKLENSINKIPLNQLFLENDDAAIDITLIFEAAAKHRNCTIEELKQAIYNNFKHIFRE